ncbi:uncharacterized protein LOC124454484 [Xenia sp. Carnegie-2017]|uniref:uncharacterized protein LOC124454484 n=1 Tax=Xenia sp. Carnegie-2017 TaxID=2897299 RepID=UPI001F04F18B|nr:uncharacterized protein LOC124454484 [Xenia sp. Carnegie-2017]
MAAEDNENALRTLIENYFYSGYKYSEIVLLLDKHHAVKMCCRTLKENSENMVSKTKNDDCIDDDRLKETIRQLINDAGSLSGYRTIWHTLRRRFHVHVSRKKVALIMKEIDPQGVQQSYEKLKPYGFPIHGAIDGYSRRVIWLEEVKSNNDPKVPANLFLKSVKENLGCPLLLWSDCGTENGLAASMQCYFRDNGTDDLAGENAHRYGSSHANQRIENWWSYFRRSRSNWWINFFKGLVHDGVVLLGNLIHMECLWFCFQSVLQNELNDIIDHWNTHYIRRSRYDTIPGVPNRLYFLPQLTGGADYIVQVPTDKINEMEEECEMEEGLNDYKEYFEHVMEIKGLRLPNNATEALALFQCLVETANDKD